jgi:hypothetical protein
MTCLSGLAALCLLVAGCASPDVNPQVPKPNTGYVDIYCPENEGIDWEVRAAVNGSSEFETIYSELYPAEGGVLRLAFAPGYHHLRVLVLNHVIKTPAEIEVSVVDGKITPVRIAFNDVGDVTVQTTETSIGPSAAGRYRRPVTLTRNEENLYDLNAVASEPIAYLPKQRMSYWRAATGGK